MSARSTVARVSGILAWLLALASPLVLWLALRSGRARQGALVLLAYAVLRALPAWLSATAGQRRAALRLPAIAVASALAGVWFDQPRALLVLPSAAQLAFAFTFWVSLSGTPLVEQFARMKEPHLGPRQLIYCRRVTQIWASVLLISALIGLILGAAASLEVWTLYTTVGIYLIIGCVFGIEYTVRHLLFRAPAAVRDLSLGESIEIPHGYVFLRGHFEDQPMVPGVVQISEIVVPYTRARDVRLGPVVGLRGARFRRPIYPGECVSVRITEVGEFERGFELWVGPTLVSNGIVVFQPKLG